MWWLSVFFILLVPLIVVEFIVFLKTRKISWLLYGMAIFSYVIAVTYMIDVFNLGRNAVILVLLASAGLMIILGRQLRTPSTDSKTKRLVTIALLAFMIVVFVVSAIFGRLQETVTPVSSIKATDLVVQQDKLGNPIAQPYSEIKILDRHVTNPFFLPVPVKSRNYQACLITSSPQNIPNLNANTRAGEHPEVQPGQSKTISVMVAPAYLGKAEKAIELLVYDFGDTPYEYSQAPCTDITQEPVYRIPIE